MRRLYTKHDGLKYILKAKQKSPKCLATPFTIKGVKWEIHKHDKDINNPSCPHMHAIGKPWKLNIYTGCFYDERTGKLLGKIKEEDLIAIWQTKGIKKIILAERAMYEELHKKDSVRFRTLPPLLVTDENKKIQISKINRLRKHNFYKLVTDLEFCSHSRKGYLESRAYLNSRSFQKSNTRKIAMK